MDAFYKLFLSGIFCTASCEENKLSLITSFSLSVLLSLLFKI